MTWFWRDRHPTNSLHFGTLRYLITSLNEHLMNSFFPPLLSKSQFDPKCLVIRRRFVLPASRRIVKTREHLLRPFLTPHRLILRKYATSSLMLTMRCIICAPALSNSRTFWISCDSEEALKHNSMQAHQRISCRRRRRSIDNTTSPD